MKKLFLAILSAGVALAALAQDSEWNGLGTGSYQPGVLDYYADEYPELLPAAVYESTTREGVYKFVPTSPGDGALVPYEVIVHTENPEKVWCETATYFKGIMNYSICHKVTEAEPPFGADSKNYGTMKDGAITFTTPESFLVMEMTGYKASNLNGKFALFMPGVNPIDDPIVGDTWTLLGKGKYVEGLLDCEYKAGVAWDVEIEKSEAHPGCYRVKPYYEGNPSCPYLPEIADTYIYIHAENEMEVYTSNVVFLNSQGKGYKLVHRAKMGEEPDYAYFGTLEDGIITFPANSHYANVVGIPGAGAMLTNTSGKACIALPGADFKDYYVEAVHTVCAQSTGDGYCKFPLTIYGGADVAGALFAVEAGKKTVDQINPSAYTDIFPSLFFGIQHNLIFPMAAEQFKTNRWTLVLIALDSNSGKHDIALTTFFTPEKDNLWKDYAEAEMTDLFVGPSYLAYNPTYKVTVQKKNGTQGQFRVVNPYLTNPEIGEDYMTGHTDHNHYLYINADDPDYVYIEESATGLDMGYGDLATSSEIGTLLNEGLTISEIKEKGVQGGTHSGDDITFPDFSLKIFETKYKDCQLQNGEGGRLLHFTQYYSGVEQIKTDSTEPARYYDMLGTEITNPASGSLYIKVQGAKTSKVIAK